MATGTCTPTTPLNKNLRTTDEELIEYKKKVQSLFNIREDEIEIVGKAAGGGSYGEVSFGRYRGKNVVKKDFKFLHKKKLRLFNYREVYALATCNHQNIVKFIGAGPDTLKSDIHYVVIERATNASLAELIHSDVKYTFWHVMLWNLHLADGLQYLHSRKEPIIHRDLKPGNMLLYDGCTTLKITDFGTSKVFGAGTEEMHSVDQGTVLYMAPEVQTRAGEAFSRYTAYTKKVDIYSLTVSLWEMLTRTLDEEVNPHLKTISGCPPFLQQLFACGLASDPEVRPSASELVVMFDFIVRKVFASDTSELFIDFCSKGGIPNVYQQTLTYSVNAEKNATVTQTSETLVPTTINDFGKLSLDRAGASGTVQGIRVDPLPSPQFPRYEMPPRPLPPLTNQRVNPEETPYPVDIEKIPPLLRPIYPVQGTEAAMAIYEQHMQLVPQYIKLSEEIRRLSSVWDARVRQIVTRKQIEPSLVKNYEMRIKMYCELYATMLPYTAVAERKIASPKKRRGIFS